MTITIGRFTVDDSPAVKIATGGGRGSHVYIITDDAITLGPSTVTDSTGLIIDENTPKPVHIELGPGQELYGICASAQDAAVQVLITESAR